MSELTATTTDVVATSRNVTSIATIRSGGTPLQGTMMGVKSFMAQPAVAKSLPMLGLLAMIGIAAFLWMSFSTPPQKDLFAGLPDQDKAAVAEALQTAGVKYNIDSGTGALSVAENDYYQARMLLASQGLPKSAPDGTQMIDKLTLGASRAVETERLRAAREADLARTIEAIDAVKTARIHLAVETPSVFLRDQNKAAASVMLTLAPGRTLSEAQVDAIVHLVASSVPGLAPDGVSVVDQNGRLLSAAGGDGVTELSERQIAVQQKIEDRYRQSLATLLTPIIGEGNFTTEVHADVDFAEVQSTREGYPKDASVLRAEEGSISSEGGGAGEAGGIPGALSNQAPPASQVAAAPGGALPSDPTQQFAGAAANGVKNQNYTRDFAVGREVSVTKSPVGQVKRLSVAVALKNPPKGKPRTQAELTAIETLVKGAVGFDQTRGDVVALSARNFAVAEEPEEGMMGTVQSLWDAGWVQMLVRNLTALAVVAIVIFGFVKPMFKKGGVALAEHSKKVQEQKAAVGGEIAAALADQAVVDPNTKVTLGMIESARSYEARASLIRGFVRQDPARAALVVRDLIRQDTKEEANG